MNYNTEMKTKKRSNSKSRFYPSIIRKDDSFCVYLPEWNISGEGKTLEEAYQQFEANKEVLELQYEKYSLAFLAPEPYPTMQKKPFYQELTLSFLKSSISIFAVVVIVILLLPNLSAAFGHQVKNIIPAEMRNPKFWAIDFPVRANARLDAIKLKDQEKIRKEWGRLINRILSMPDGLNKSLSKTRFHHSKHSRNTEPIQEVD